MVVRVTEIVRVKIIVSVEVILYTLHLWSQSGSNAVLMVGLLSITEKG